MIALLSKRETINNIHFKELFFLLLIESLYKMLYVKYWWFKIGYNQKGVEHFVEKEIIEANRNKNMVQMNCFNLEKFDAMLR